MYPKIVLIQQILLPKQRGGSVVKALGSEGEGQTKTWLNWRLGCGC